MMMLVLTVCSFEGTWNIDRNEKQCESAVFFFAKLKRSIVVDSKPKCKLKFFHRTKCIKISD
ncbi:MAG: hypothetical protein EGP69_08660 [[Ruminococcus] faecis]|nr:hypothetical protein [Mediterraneibacter faecis]